ncbi:MAG TPA: dienelactone hydrolase family protein [Blastocatellia bacterium]|nr:dienelactone hydrolase family protein [Blastocatellia bacterium]
MWNAQNKLQTTIFRDVNVPLGQISLRGKLDVPAKASSVVLFAHGSGSSRLSPRNQFVAEVIRKAGLGTLLFDLLTPNEEAIDAQTRHLRFDITMLARRLAAATEWIKNREETAHLRIGYFGASTGAAAALIAASEFGNGIRAVVSRGGRPDLAGEALPRVTAPTLLIVGGLDEVVIRLNEEALAQLRCVKKLKIVPGATHLFEEPGTLEEVARLAADWFRLQL